MNFYSKILHPLALISEAEKTYFKSSGTSKTRYLKYRFFADSLKGRLLQSSQIEQGAYQLHKDFCLQFESSCEGCPFIERMQFRKLYP